MRVISLNVNGIRAAFNKGLPAWLATQQADFICLQETKAQLNKPLLAHLRLANYQLFAADAVKPGYSGVAIFARESPINIITQLGWTCADQEGRFIQLDYLQYTIISIYLPSGTSGSIRQAEKIFFLKKLTPVLINLFRCKRRVIVSGDWNIAHCPLDLKNWRANQKLPGFLPEERAWVDHLLTEIGWRDAFRVLHSQLAAYSWWSNRANAWQNDVGWRIDYQLITPDVVPVQAVIYRTPRFSDHAPVVIDYAPVNDIA